MNANTNYFGFRLKRCCGWGLYLHGNGEPESISGQPLEICRGNLFMQRTLLVIIQLCILSVVAATVCVGSIAKAQYTLSTLATFNGTNGELPQAALIADTNGNLYGTASGGGANDYGTVFKLSPVPEPATGLP